MMGVSKPIPAWLREEMAADPFYARCCVTGGGRKTDNRHDPERIEWHHNLIFAGERVNEAWCILPIVKRVHDRARVSEVKEVLDWIMLNRGSDEDLRRYSKAENLISKRDRLNKKLGTWDSKNTRYTLDGRLT